MVILAINTATSNTEIALLEAEPHKQNAKVLAERSWESTNNEAEKLMPEIAGLLEEAGIDFGDVEHVVVVKGPGSFTGLRIGITVANTIAYLNGCGLTGLSTFEYLHRKISDKKGGVPADIPVLLFAGKGGVYLSETSDSEPKLIDLPDLSEAVKKFEKVSGDISDEQKEKLSSVTTSAPKFIEVKKSFGEVMVEFTKDIPGDEISHKTRAPLKLVKPLYIKPPTITKSKSCYT